MYKWHKSKYTYKPNLQLVSDDDMKPTILKTMSLDEIRKQQENNNQFDLFEEMGGCGCFVDYDEDEYDYDNN